MGEVTKEELIEALVLAIKALNATSNFDTKLPSDNQYSKAVGRGQTSYELLPKLEAVVKRAGGKIYG